MKQTSSKISKKVRIGEILVQKGLLNSLQLKQALAEQGSRGQKLGEVLVQKELVTRPQLVKALTEQFFKNFLATLLLSLGTLTATSPLVGAQGTSKPDPNLRTSASLQIGWVKWQHRKRINLREEPSTSATILAHLKPGMKVNILRQILPFGSSHSAWYKVESQGKQGFVDAAAIDILSGNIGGGADQVAFRSQPTETSPLLGFCHPLMGEGVISQAPNNLITHRGRMKYAFDFAVPMGQPVYAMASGKVVGLQDRYPDTGGGRANFRKFNYVLLEHSDGYRSAYLHLNQGFKSQVKIKIGDRIPAGQLIAYSGNSGWSLGPHLHVEIHYPQRNGGFGGTVPFNVDHLCAP